MTFGGGGAGGMGEGGKSIPLHGEAGEAGVKKAGTKFTFSLKQFNINQDIGRLKECLRNLKDEFKDAATGTGSKFSRTGKADKVVAELKAIIPKFVKPLSVEDGIDLIQNPRSPLNEAITTLMAAMRDKKPQTATHKQKYAAAKKLEAGLKSLIEAGSPSSPTSSIQTSPSSIIVSGLTLETRSGGNFSNKSMGQ